MNPTALNQYGIPLETVRSALAATTQYRPKGQLATRRGLGNRVQRSAPQASEYASVIIAFRSGRPVRLSDVAQIEGLRRERAHERAREWEALGCCW